MWVGLVWYGIYVRGNETALGKCKSSQLKKNKNLEYRLTNESILRKSDEISMEITLFGSEKQNIHA